MSNVQEAAEKETFIIEEGYGLEREGVPEYIPTPIKRAETKSKVNDKREKNGEQTVTGQKGEGKSEMATGNSLERDSDIREDDIVDLEDENMSFSSLVKRSRGEEEKGSCSHKKARLEEGERLRVDVQDICEKTMMKIVERSEKVVEGNRVISEKALKAMKEGTLVLSKLVVTVNSLQRTVEDCDRREERREERRREFELKREEDWRKALSRLIEEERNLEDRKREFERKEREEKKDWEERRNRKERKDKEERRDREDRKDKEERRDREERRTREEEKKTEGEKENHSRARSLAMKPMSQRNRRD